MTAGNKTERSCHRHSDRGLKTNAMKWKCKMFVCLFANHLNASNIEGKHRKKKESPSRQMMAGPKVEAKAQKKKKNGKLRKSLEEMFEIFQSSQRAARPQRTRQNCCKIMLKSKITAAATEKRALQATAFSGWQKGVWRKKGRLRPGNPCVPGVLTVLGIPEYPGYSDAKAERGDCECCAYFIPCIRS